LLEQYQYQYQYGLLKNCNINININIENRIDLYPCPISLEYIFIGYFRGVFQTLRQIRLEEGLAGWYSGLKVNLIRQIPNNAIMMCTVEYIIYSWTRYVNQ